MIIDDISALVTISDNGHIVVSDIVNGQLVTRRYIGYSIDESIAAFCDYIESLSDGCFYNEP